MKHRIFSVYDEKAHAYLPPFVFPETGMAVRTFGDCLTDDGHQFGKHPSDYTLFDLGEFDDSNGAIESVGRGKVANGVELLGVSDSAAGNGFAPDDLEDSHASA